MTRLSFLIAAGLAFGPLATPIAQAQLIGRGVVAAITGIGDAAIQHVANERFHLRNDRAERVSVIKGLSRFAGARRR